MIWENIWIALRAIRVNTLRAVLTTLGIVIGITAVTSMVTVINGIDRQFEQTLSELGADVLYVEKWPWAQGPGFKWWEYRNRPPIQAELADAIAERSEHAVAVTVVATTGRSVSYGSTDLSGVTVEGATGTYDQVHVVRLAVGRFYTDFDNRTARNVAVIGAAVAEQLFPVETPLGKQVSVDGHPFTVVGVLERKGSGQDDGSEDAQIKIPLQSFKSLFGTSRRSLSVQVRVASAEAVPAAQDELTGILRVARGLDAREKDDFEINQQQSLREQLRPVKFAIYGIGIFLTALSLLVGGIGVMNIMFVSVTERTREIGIRKAMGATKRTILTQFLIEAIVICLMGGAIAVGLAFGLSRLIAQHMPAYLSVSTVVMALTVCAILGIGFGLAPAWRAARAEPVDALRYE